MLSVVTKYKKLNITPFTLNYQKRGYDPKKPIEDSYYDVFHYNKYRTTPFIPDILTSEQNEQKFKWPLETREFIEMQPINYKLNVSSMSKEKIKFTISCVFTIGPKNDDDSIERFERICPIVQYDKLIKKNSPISEMEEAAEYFGKLEKIINGIIQVKQIINDIITVEIRVLTSSIPIDEIFSNVKKYKEILYKNIQCELAIFGLGLYNIDIKEIYCGWGHE